MVRFQPPPVTRVDDGAASSSSGSDSEERGVRGVRQSQQGRGTQPPSQRKQTDRQYSAESGEDEDEEIQLPLRGRTPRAPATASVRKRQPQKEEEYSEELDQPQMDDAYEEEEERKYHYENENDAYTHSSSYPVRHGATYSRPTTSYVDPRKLHLMDQVLLDEEEENYRRQQQQQEMDEQQEEQQENEEEEVGDEELQMEEEAEEQQEQEQYLPSKSMKRKSRIPVDPMKAFLSSIPRYVKPLSLSEFQPNNPLVSPPLPSSPPSSSRNLLDFHRHSYRVCWHPLGTSFFLPSDIAGVGVSQVGVDLMAVEVGAINEKVGVELERERVNLMEKKEVMRHTFEAHLSFHSQGVEFPFSATVFGAAAAAAQSSFSSSSPFSLSTSLIPAPPSSSLTSFTRLCDIYLSVLESVSTSTSSPMSPALQKQIQFALSTFHLLKSLYSKEEAENRAPKLSKGMEEQLRKQRGEVSSSSSSSNQDLSVLTAQEDEYALFVGRENAFEQGWLQPSITRSYVQKRIQQLHAGLIA